MARDTALRNTITGILSTNVALEMACKCITLDIRRASLSSDPYTIL